MGFEVSICVRSFSGDPISIQELGIPIQKVYWHGPGIRIGVLCMVWGSEESTGVHNKVAIGLSGAYSNGGFRVGTRVDAIATLKPKA